MGVPPSLAGCLAKCPSSRAHKNQGEGKSVS